MSFRAYLVVWQEGEYIGGSVFSERQLAEEYANAIKHHEEDDDLMTKVFTLSDNIDNGGYDWPLLKGEGNTR